METSVSKTQHLPSVAITGPMSIAATGIENITYDIDYAKGLKLTNVDKGMELRKWTVSM